MGGKSGLAGKRSREAAWLQLGKVPHFLDQLPGWNVINRFISPRLMVFWLYVWLQQVNYIDELFNCWTPTVNSSFCYFLLVMMCSFHLACINVAITLCRIVIHYVFTNMCMFSLAPFHWSPSVWERARPDLQPYNPSALVLHSLQTKHTLITVAVSAWRALPPHKFINTRHNVQYKTRYTGPLQ